MTQWSRVRAKYPSHSLAERLVGRSVWGQEQWRGRQEFPNRPGQGPSFPQQAGPRLGSGHLLGHPCLQCPLSSSFLSLLPLLLAVTTASLSLV